MLDCYDVNRLEHVPKKRNKLMGEDLKTSQNPVTVKRCHNSPFQHVLPTDNVYVCDGGVFVRVG